jgi:hypothetical protein
MTTGCRVLMFVLGLVGTACTGVGKKVESLDPAKLKPDEVVVVVRFLTSRTEGDDLDVVEHDPDLSYSVTVGTSKSVLLGGLGMQGNISVDGEDGPALIVRKLAAGDYYFNRLTVSGGDAPMAVKFKVQPGRVTYIGDLDVLFIEKKGFLGMSDLSCAFDVGGDLPAVMNELRSRFPMVPEVDSVLMTVENPSL